MNTINLMWLKFKVRIHEGLLREILDGIEDLKKENRNIMSAITDWAAQEQADLTAISTTLDGIVTGVQNLDTLIQQLQSGTLNAADQAALDAVKTASAALVTKSAAISTAPPATV